MTRNSADGRVVFECPRFWVVETERIAPDGARVPIWYLEAAPWTRVVAFEEDGRVHLVREFSLAREEWVWRLPGGRVEPGEDPTVAAHREFEEELGLRTADGLELLFREVPTASWYRQEGFVFAGVVLGASASGPQLEHGESVVPAVMSAQEAVELADGGLLDAWTEKAVRHGLLWFSRRRDARG